MSNTNSTVAVPREDYDELVKSLNWLNDNRGIHPANVERVMLDLRKRFVVDSTPTRDVDRHW